MVAVAGNNHMGFWKTIVNLRDGSRERIKREVAESAIGREQAASRLEDTIRELLETNDRVTGRIREHETVHK